MRTVEAYVDGSYSSGHALYSYGVVLLDNDEVVDTLQGSDDTFIESNQIAGELFGCLYAIQWAIQNSYDKITVYHDYTGIEKFAIGEWRPGKEVSKAYLAVYTKLSPYIEIEFVKVKAHTGNQYNEMADDIAKSALSI